jgi:signal transduction histidine kinase
LTPEDITVREDFNRHGGSSFQTNLKNKGRHTFEVKHITKSGIHFPVEINANLIDINNNPYILSLVRDITERKQVERDREMLQTKLIQSQKMESIGRLAGGVAHDFNNMLGVILGNTEFVLQQVKKEQQIYDDLLEIQKAARRSADLTKQLLAFARKQTVTPEVINLNDTISSTLKMLKRIIGEEIELIWNPAKSLWPVKMDPYQVDQILTNLCLNARDAVAKNGKVSISTYNTTVDSDYLKVHVGYVSGDYATITVCDDGCGMDGAEISRVFEPFYTTKRVGEGTGLGLATVYGTVKQNRGYVSVQSETGVGTTFTILLPRYSGNKESDKHTVTDHPIPSGDATILLVEDEQSILRISEKMLRSLGYEVLAADSPAEAIRLAEKYQDQIDLLITDIIMPEMDGHTLANKLTSLYPELKRLFMSGYTENVIANHGIVEKGIYFLHKPFSIDSLASKVSEVLSK